MKTRALMSISAVFLAVLGVALTFLPQELLVHTSAQPTQASVLLIQVLGAMLLGSATLNWMNRGAHIGGIYGRPVSMANFLHFAVGAVSLLKGAFALGFPLDVAVVASAYTLFATWFGLVLFTHPAPPTPA
jgi:hypothetical protein